MNKGDGPMSNEADQLTGLDVPAAPLENMNADLGLMGAIVAGNTARINALPSHYFDCKCIDCQCTECS
jgi:hypothetical protein